MSELSDAAAWAAIFALGVATYLVRASFVLFAGGREFPAWAMRLLRYVPVTVLPALAAPMAVWPRALEGETDPTRIAGVAVTVTVGILTRSLLGAIAAGLATFAALGALF
ncbi:MAG: AzlD domain-containing protein [Pseudomonadota bacterium]|nr:AzlD domain-containing protein [Pseudomonadota bacterium]